MLQDGRRGVLKEEIAAYLEGLGLPAALATGNDGMLVLRAQDLHRWIASSPPPAWAPLELSTLQHNRPVQTDWLDLLSGS